jgi:hypothetical protein
VHSGFLAIAGRLTGIFLNGENFRKILSGDRGLFLRRGGDGDRWFNFKFPKIMPELPEVETIRSGGKNIPKKASEKEK